jgi:heme/copper-type cytochrome/quinol oxidase subunit 2
LFPLGVVRLHPGVWARRLRLLALCGAMIPLAGCGPHYLLLHPAGPVAAIELHLMERAALPMGAVILLVWALCAIVLVRFRDRPGNRAPYTPEWEGSRRLEALWFIIPVLIVVFIAVPTVRQTFRLTHLPVRRQPLTIDVVALDYKWLFEYPAQRIATVNFLDVPAGTPLLFELTAYAPMDTFWVPQLGGMEFAMPGRVLPLYLEASTPGTYMGRSANYSGAGYAKMTFAVHALPQAAFGAWVQQVRSSAAPLTETEYRALLRQDLTGLATYAGYPPSTFPAVSDGFTLKGGTYPTAALR